MDLKKRMLLGAIVASACVLAASTVWAGQESQERAGEANVKLPDAVARAVKVNFPNAEIATAELQKETGISLYDIEFKAGRGEIEVAEDGTVIDVTTIITANDLPRAALEAIQKVAQGATIKQLEKSEVRAEIKKEGEMGKIVKLAAPKYVYEAELIEGQKRGEIQVTPNGQIVEALKWGAGEAEKKEEMNKEEEVEENEEAEEKEEAEEVKPAAPAVDLKILPPAVLSAFKTAYPNAVIKGTSKETEKGIAYYEVESVDGKLNRDLLYTGDGKAVEIEEAVPPANLPAAVRKTLGRDYPGAKILKAEGLTKGDQKLFELEIEASGKKLSVTIDPSGKIVK